MSQVIVAGSINIDLVASVVRHPAPGETVTGASLQSLPGGKGANQAVAAARAGAPTRLLGAVGYDPFGDDLLRFLDGAGVDLQRVRRRIGVPTGTALCVVDADGENTIVVVPGANATVDAATVQAPDPAAGDVFVAQYEIPVDSVAAFLAQGRAVGATTILNPAPAAPTSSELLALVDILVLNATELTSLSGRGVDTTSPVDEVGIALRALRPLGLGGAAVVTLGARGAVALVDDQLRPVPGRVVQAVDTTGAGDCFVGSLAAELAAGSPLDAALEYANAAAALCVTRPGAGPSLPSRAEVESFAAPRPQP